MKINKSWLSLPLKDKLQQLEAISYKRRKQGYVYVGK